MGAVAQSRSGAAHRQKARHEGDREEDAEQQTVANYVPLRELDRTVAGKHCVAQRSCRKGPQADEDGSDAQHRGKVATKSEEGWRSGRVGGDVGLLGLRIPCITAGSLLRVTRWNLRRSSSVGLTRCSSAPPTPQGRRYAARCARP